MNHYNDIVLKISELVANKQDAQALKIIEEELSMPYVPKEVEEILLSYKDEIQPQQVLKSTVLSEEDVEHHLFSKDPLYVSAAMQHLHDTNVRKYIDIVKKFLLDTTTENLLKNSILDILIAQKVDESIKIIYENGDQHMVNPANAKRVLDPANINPILTIIDDIVSGFDISVRDVACQLIEIVMLQAYPNDIVENHYDISLALTLKANDMLNNPSDPKIIAKLFNQDPEKINILLSLINEIIDK